MMVLSKCEICGEPFQLSAALEIHRSYCYEMKDAREKREAIENMVSEHQLEIIRNPNRTGDWEQWEVRGAPAMVLASKNVGIGYSPMSLVNLTVREARKQAAAFFVAAAIVAGEFKPQED